MINRLNLTKGGLPMSIAVLKFGGSSLSNAKKLINAAQIVKETLKKYKKVALIVSAQGDTTDDLIERAEKISTSPNPRELDALLACGEQQSAALVALALLEIDVQAVSLNAFQAGICCDGVFGNSRIVSIDEEKIKNRFTKSDVIVITGFQGIDAMDNISTLGRGGSDTSAVAVAAALKAEVCVIYTDVDGVFSADPRKVPQAVLIEKINFDEMLEFASLGAGVLHSRSVEVGKKYGIEIEVKNNNNASTGTRVSGDYIECGKIKGVTSQRHCSLLELDTNSSGVSLVAKLFSKLAQKRVTIDFVSLSGNKDGSAKLAVCVKTDDAHYVEEEMSALSKNGVSKSRRTDGLAKISLVGCGIAGRPETAARLLRTLAEGKIEIYAIAINEMKISTLIDERQEESALSAAHREFIN